MSDPMNEVSRTSKEKVEQLRDLRVRLKSGEYSGTDIMQAWIVLGEYADALERTAPEPRADLPKPINHDLWLHLHDEHGLTLLQSELDEILRLAQPPVPEQRAPSVTLNGRQIAAVYDFMDLAAGSASGYETDVSIQWFEERPPVDGEPSPAGYYAWITDYPEEGSLHLNDQPSETKGEG